jgi:hypothetical protein
MLARDGIRLTRAERADSSVATQRICSSNECAGVAVLDAPRAHVTDWTIGYGWKPWKSLIWLSGVVFVAVVIAICAGVFGGLKLSGSSGTSDPCTPVQWVGVGLDLGLPLIDTEASKQCVPTTEAAGQWLTAAGWVLQLLAWAFAGLFAAGFTSAVRKAG